MSHLSAGACEIHTAVITHEHGTEHYAAATEQGLLAELAGFCRTHWAEERRRHPSLPELAPADDTEASETYFENVSEEALDRGTAHLAPLAALGALDDDALADSHVRLQPLAATVASQRAAVAAERARRQIAELAPRIASVKVWLDSDSLALAMVAFDDTGWFVDFVNSFPADARPQLHELLAEATATASGTAVIHILADDAARSSQQDGTEDAEINDAGEQLPYTDAIVARIKRELPARSGRRRVRWTVADLQAVIELATSERAALARISEEDQEDRGDALDTLDRIAETAERLIAARTGPAGDGAVSASEAQVAYLMPVEMVVNLEEGAVTRVVVIDEAIELDAEEGARASGTLAALPAEQARTAVAIAELVNGGDQPPMQFGW